MKKKKKNVVFEDVITTISRCFIVLVVVVVICIAFSGIRFVKPGEVAIVLRFGKVVGETRDEQIHEPGLLFAFPYIIDEVITVPTGTVMERVVETHYTDPNLNLVDSNINNIGYLITGDNNIVTMKVSAKYTVTDPVKYALHVKDVGSIIDACVSNAMLEKAAATNYDEILTTGKDTFNSEVKNLTQEKINANNLGVTLTSFEFLNIQAPADVKNAYDSVLQASVALEQKVKAAQSDKQQILMNAESEAQKLTTGAESQKAQMIAKANSDLAEFWGVKEEYEKSYASKSVVRTRIKNEKLSEALSSIGEVIIVKDKNGHIIIN